MFKKSKNELSKEASDIINDLISGSRGNRKYDAGLSVHIDDAKKPNSRNWKLADTITRFMHDKNLITLTDLKNFLIKKWSSHSAALSDVDAKFSEVMSQLTTRLDKLSHRKGVNLKVAGVKAFKTIMNNEQLSDLFPRGTADSDYRELFAQGIKFVQDYAPGKQPAIKQPSQPASTTTQNPVNTSNSHPSTRIVPGSQNTENVFPGSTDIPYDHIRLFYSAPAADLEHIAKYGIDAMKVNNSRKRPTDWQPYDDILFVEFHISKNGWNPWSSMLYDDVPPSDIIAVHYPWHYFDNDRSALSTDELEMADKYKQEH